MSKNKKTEIIEEFMDFISNGADEDFIWENEELLNKVPGLLDWRAAVSAFASGIPPHKLVTFLEEMRMGHKDTLDYVEIIEVFKEWYEEYYEIDEL